MKFLFFVLFVLALSPLCFAQFAIPNLSLEKSGLGELRCLSFLGSNEPKQCWVLKAMAPLDFENTRRDVILTQLQIVEVGMDRDQSFFVGIRWKGASGGTFEFGGPEGTLLAEGSFSREADRKLRIDRFVDASMSEELDRSQIFNESNPELLKNKTLLWLNEVVVPFLEKNVFSTPTLPHP